MNIILDLLLPLSLLIAGLSILAKFQWWADMVERLEKPISESRIGRKVPSMLKFRIAFFALLLVAGGAYGLLRNIP